VRRLAREDRLRVLFVNPLSVSGRIAPEFALREEAIALLPSENRYTHSHTESLRLLIDNESRGEEIAFVWDDALRNAPVLTGRVRKIEIPALERLELPQMAIALRADLPEREELERRIVDYRNGEGQATFQRVEDWPALYRPVLTWSEELGVSSLSELAQNVSLEEIGRMLLCRAAAPSAPTRWAPSRRSRSGWPSCGSETRIVLST
jgi:hypothetical protein